MTDQETFNKVYTHLLTQGEKSLIGTKCAYRGAEGRKCAVGCLIPDKLYYPALEGNYVYVEKLKEVLAKAGQHSLFFLSQLQFIHDESAVEDWKEQLEQLAKKRGLAVPSVVWHLGPPPHVGWWNASTGRSPKMWRWWDGNFWSVPFHPESKDFSKMAYHKSDQIEWTNDWPANARIERVAP